MGKFLLPLFLVMAVRSYSQELYIWAEPASNMPARVWGIRNNNLLSQHHKLSIRNELEVMYGASRMWMLHASVFASNVNSHHYSFDGVSTYFKFRFYNRDGDHRHFRMAAFGRASYCNNRMSVAEINLEGDNTGIGIGVITTKLVHRIAVSNTIQFSEGIVQKGFYNSERMVRQFSDVISIGYLAHPKRYVSYKQTNLNFYLEAIIANSGYLDKPSVGYWYADIAPSIQLIFNSQTRLDISFRKRLLNIEDENDYKHTILLRLQHDFLD